MWEAEVSEYQGKAFLQNRKNHDATFASDKNKETNKVNQNSNPKIDKDNNAENNGENDNTKKLSFANAITMEIVDIVANNE